MKLYTIWVSTDGDWEGAWLFDAWDEYSRDNNDTGWSDALDKAEKQGGEMRIIAVNVDSGDLEKQFSIPNVKGEVVE